MSLVEQATQNHVRYDDKVTSAYLRLRQELLQAYNGEKDPETLAKLRFELDRTALQFASHIRQQIRTVSHPDTFPYGNDLQKAKEDLQKEVDELSARIADTRQNQKPLLDRMGSLVERYTQATHATLETDPVLKSSVLTYTAEEIASLVGAEEAEIMPILHNVHMFTKTKDGYRFRLNKMSSGKTLEDLDESIRAVLGEIEEEKRRREVLREKWEERARKVEEIERSIQRI